MRNRLCSDLYRQTVEDDYPHSVWRGWDPLFFAPLGCTWSLLELPPFASFIPSIPRFPWYQPLRSLPTFFMSAHPHCSLWMAFLEETIVSEQIRKSFLPLSYKQQIAWKLISLIYGTLFRILKPVISKEIILAIRRLSLFFVLSCMCDVVILMKDL